MAGRRSAKDAELTRARIVDAGVDQASAKGVTGLTIGSLAGSVAMSKAGVVGPFRSREGLQVAVLDRAVGKFVTDVVEPTESIQEGLPRLRALIDRWIDYLVDGPFAHGCFITATSCELQGQPGPLQDRTAHTVRAWRDLLLDQIRAAQARGEADRDADAQSMVTALVGVSMACNQEAHLLGDHGARKRAHELMTKVVEGGTAR